MTKIKIDNLSFSYGNHRILTDVSARIRTNCITAITGPSGQGKSTFLTILNRLCENDENAGWSGKVHIRFDGKYQDIFHPKTDVMTLRRKVALVFQVPNPLPMSIYKNVAFSLKLKGGYSKGQIQDKVVHALERSFLFKEVKDRLHKDARLLSGGQQQRLCIARALILDPEVLLLDEPTSSLDEKSGRVIENLLTTLKENCTILLVSHSSDQVKRIADECLTLSDQCLTYQDIRGICN